MRRIWQRVPVWIKILLVMGFIVVGIVGGGILYQFYIWTYSPSTRQIVRWFISKDNRPPMITTRTEPCPQAPFLLPTEGFIGLLYADASRPYSLRRRHPGIDIFGNGQPGEIPVVAAYDGYLSRPANWISTVIIRHTDPLNEGETIWTYHTHMANRSGTESFIHEDFPAGTNDLFVEQGRLLGYQGDYGGTQRVGLHLHFSVVKSHPDGNYKNEAIFGNTLDPSPYFGMNLDVRQSPQFPIDCQA